MKAVFKSHNEAFCMNCGGDFGDTYWYTRHNSFRGAGLYQQCCVKCDSITSYDLEEDLQYVGTYAYRQSIVS